MATINLNPSSTVSNNWNIFPASQGAHTVLSDSNVNSAIRTPGQSKECILELDDFDDVGLDEASIASIDSIRHYVSGFLFNTRGGDTEIQVKLEDSSGTDLYSENHTLNFNGYTPEDHYGTARTTSNGSDAWTVSDINGLRLSINTTPEDPPSLSQANVVKAYVEVTYTLAGYSNTVTGVASANISTVNGVATANIDKVNGV